MAKDAVVDKQVSYWQGELGRARKRFGPFWEQGDAVVDVYRLQKADGAEAVSKDKYNILYSSTETIRPNLYAKTPTPRVSLRSKDTATEVQRVAAQILESCLKYVMSEEDFDELMDSAVEDFLLPGMGNAWVRYEASFENKSGEDGKPLLDSTGQPEQELLDEMVKMEYVYWQDFLCGIGRTWKEVPWVARRCWMTKADVAKRFGANVANALKYMAHDTAQRDLDNQSETAEVWEIWDKTTRKVYWYADDQKEMIDQKDDPLKLKRFFPCPRPIRAIFNTRTFVPRNLYSQYKSQAETLNVLTKRIRLLGEALRVTGLYDGSQAKLADVLNPSAGNRMIAVDAWALFAQNGGINGSVQWVPIDTITKTLNELLKAREVCKQEIYEITGFSDVVRGVSKASETLGAQNIKADWASARIKKMQGEIQRFARDVIALAGELIAEHCGMGTLAVFSGVAIPSAQEVQSDPALQEQVKTFKGACDLIKSDIRRTSVIEIDTDSTLAANEEGERQERAQFLAAAGAFLQQAVPAMEATPELGPLLGALLMFTVRSFPSSRVIEDQFEKVEKAMASRADNPDKDGKKAEAAAKQAQQQADTQHKANELSLRQQEGQAKAAAEQAKSQALAQAEQNRHAERMEELAIKRQELALKDRDVAATESGAQVAKFTALHDAGMAELGVEKEVEQNVRDYEVENRWIEDASEGRDLEAKGLDDAAKAQEAAQDAPDETGEG